MNYMNKMKVNQFLPFQWRKTLRTPLYLILWTKLALLRASFSNYHYLTFKTVHNNEVFTLFLKEVSLIFFTLTWKRHFVKIEHFIPENLPNEKTSRKCRNGGACPNYGAPLFCSWCYSQHPSFQHFTIITEDSICTLDIFIPCIMRGYYLG